MLYINGFDSRTKTIIISEQLHFGFRHFHHKQTNYLHSLADSAHDIACAVAGDSVVGGKSKDI